MVMRDNNNSINDIIVWEPTPDPIFDGDRITCHIGNTVISGKVSLSPKAISVAIDFPKEMEIVGKSIGLLTPLIFTESIEDGSPASWYGLIIARELLLSQYYGDVEEKG